MVAFFFITGKGYVNLVYLEQIIVKEPNFSQNVCVFNELVTFMGGNGTKICKEKVKILKSG